MPTLLQQPKTYQRRSCTLSMAPRIVPRLLALIQNPNANPEDIIELLRLDAALTAALIAVCRSAAIKRGDEVETVDDAVRCLGFLGVYRIVVLAAFKSGYSDHFYAYEDSPDALWRRTVMAGYYMDEFADELGGNRGLCYSCGLLHAIGMFYIDWHCEDRQLPSIPVSNRDLLLGIERTVTGTTHTELSATILDYWNFPAPIVEAIAYCDSIPELRHRHPLADALALAIRLASASKTELAQWSLPEVEDKITTPGGNSLGPAIQRVEQLMQSTEHFMTL